MKIEKINRKNCALLSDEILKALAPIAEKYGLELDRKGGKFDESSFTLPVVMKVGGLVEQKAEEDFRLYASMFDCDPDWFGKTFKTHDGKTLKVVGLNTRSPKNRIALEDENGTGYKCPVGYVERFLGKNKK